MAVAIVTDSTSDLDPARAAELGVAVVPLFVTFGDRSYRDVVELSRAEFYDRLEHGTTLPGTSQPTAAMFEEAFAACAGRDVVCITISSHLSGTINAARAAATAAGADRISIFDSQSASGGLGLLVLRAAELAAGGADRDAIVSALERERAQQRLFACLPDLSHLQRTGRIGRARAAVGTLMRIVPVLSLEDGQVVATAQVRTFGRAQETMLDLALGGLARPSDARFIIVHTDAPALAAQNRDRLMERLGGATPRLLEIWEAGPVIATHGGRGAVGICVGV